MKIIKPKNKKVKPYTTYKTHKTVTKKVKPGPTIKQRYNTMVKNSLSLTKWKRKDTDTILKFNVRRLHWYCTQDIQTIWKRLGATIEDGLSGQHGFIDNGADILAVAHLDVSPSIEKYRKSFFVSNRKIFCPSLDDRLGAYLICDVLPALGLKFDILLTENEEIGMSTAGDFFPEGKAYKWMFQFDRHGSDVVMYQYHDLETKERLTDAGFTVGHGSFSDICYLDHLGCKGFNFGTGYDNEHSRLCYADLKVTSAMVNTFINFFRANHENEMIHVETAPQYYLDTDGGWEVFDDDWSALDYKYKDKQSIYQPYSNYDRVKAKSTEEYWDQAASTYEVVQAQLYNVYGPTANMDKMQWSDYCELVGIDPGHQMSWSDQDWRIWTIMGDF